MASTIQVHVKHNKTLYKDISINLSQPSQVFKAQLFTLTGVPVDRQKVIIKGKPLADDVLMFFLPPFLLFCSRSPVITNTFPV